MKFIRFKYIIRRAILQAFESFRRLPFEVRMIKAFERQSIRWGTYTDEVIIEHFGGGINVYEAAIPYEGGKALFKEVRRALPNKKSFIDDQSGIMDGNRHLWCYTLETLDMEAFKKRFPTVEIEAYKYKVDKVAI